MAHIHINLHVPTPSGSKKQNLQDTSYSRYTIWNSTQISPYRKLRNFQGLLL